MNELSTHEAPSSFVSMVALWLRQVVLSGTDWSRFAASDRHFGGWCKGARCFASECIAGVKKTFKFKL